MKPPARTSGARVAETMIVPRRRSPARRRGRRRPARSACGRRAASPAAARQLVEGVGADADREEEGGDRRGEATG